LKNSSVRIIKFSIALIFAIFAWWNLSNLPWYPPVMLNLKGVVGHTVNLKLEKSDHEIVYTNIYPTEAKSIYNIPGSRIITLEVSPSVNATIIFTSNEQHQSLQLINGSASFPLQSSMSKNQYVVEAYTIVSVMFFLILWFLLEQLSWSSSKRWPIYAGIFLLHSCFLGLLFWGSFPGFLGHDTFNNYSNALSYRPSSVFLGDLYSSIMIVLMQLIPKVWVTSLLNSLVILTCLTTLSTIAVRLNVIKFYFLGLCLFFLYPANSLISFFGVRDITSLWVFTTTILLFYSSYITKDTSFKNVLGITICTIIACLTRQEAFIILLPGMIIISYLVHKTFFKPSLIMASVTLLASLLTNIISVHPMEAANYHATLIVNPLSYILKNKYPQGLPEQVNRDLGTYFKNEYLVQYQEDFEILPFHKGGVNFLSTQKDYNQFRSAAIMIILSSPWLFLKNRINMAGYIFGFNTNWSFIYSDEYSFSPARSSEYIEDVKSELSVPKYSRPSWGFKMTSYSGRLIRQHPIVFASYIIPLLLILGLFITRYTSRFYALLCLILGARIILVCLIAPAGYFKYQYPLWLFAPFSLFLLVAEKRRKLTNPPAPFTTL